MFNKSNRVHCLTQGRHIVCLFEYIYVTLILRRIWALCVSWVTSDKFYYHPCLNCWALFGSLVPAMCNRTSCAQLHELPWSHLRIGNNREGTLSVFLTLYIYIHIYIYTHIYNIYTYIHINAYVHICIYIYIYMW